MFNFLTKKIKNLPVIASHEGPKQSPPIEIKIQLQNLDCPSCAVDLDLALEEIPGIISAKTNYAKSELKISFDPNKISQKKISKTLTDLGYQII